ncbi:amidohydrolase family protein [Mycobacterium spongiae]|uniref:Amidohydrolase family protein n=2 Tax=Mycobacterium spongiae TaxID=886343 RepID=A0A975K3C6_9MYCO|nr:amidohydrolase family protein [Mycobacterium spongiae]
MDPYVIISADCHAELPTEQYREYVDPEYREDFEEYLLEKAAAAQVGGFIDEEFAEQWFSEHGDGIAGGWDVGLRDKELDGDGVVGEVIFPDADAVSGVAGAPFGAGLAQSGDLDPGRAMAGARAHNRWLAELCSHSPERRAGVAVVPILADVDAAVAEISRAAESGLRGGIMIPALWGGYPPYHDRRYDKVWAACQDLQMPVHTHVGAAPQEEFGGHLGIYVTEVRWWGVRPLWFALWSGVFERFPRLRWGATECGAFWANDLLWLMDTRYLREHSAKKMSRQLEGDLTMPPSAYFDRNCFIGATTTERRELARRYEIGVSNMLWGNDFPHPEGTWPHTREWLRRSFWDIPIQETRQILGLEAAEVYNFDMGALAGLAARIGPTPEDLGQDDSVSIPKWEAARAAGRHWLTDAEPLADVATDSATG